MRIYRLEIPGQPIPKQSFRFSGKNGVRRGFVHPRITDRQNFIATFAKSKGVQCTAGRVEIEVGFRRETLVSADLDNCLKLLKDALKKIAWVDDKQIRKYREVSLEIGVPQAVTYLTIYQLDEIPD